jgi:putative spermidine/putrescine transport system substrate-binding protein
MNTNMRVTLSALLILALGLATSACGSGGSEQGGATQQSWSEIEKEAQGTTVNFVMYGGNDALNSYIDKWVAPRVKEEYGITLERTPVSDTADAVNKLLNEKQAGKQEGTADLIWVNGENFFTGSQADLWFGPWAEQLPNAKYIDWDADIIKKDFGFPVNGYEAPWGQAQFVMIYDSAKIDDPPKTAQELKQWVADNPGKFTYPAPPDFTGNAFVEQIFYQTTGGPGKYQQKFDKSVFEEQAPEFYDYMNSIEENLWREGNTYPESSTKLDDLYQNGQVNFTMSYNPYYAQQQVEKGIFPESTKSYLFEGGTLANTSYTAIPFNSTNKSGAQVVANFLESPKAQIEYQKQQLNLSVLDPDKLPEDKAKQLRDSTPSGESVVPLQKLRENRVPEARSEWLLQIQDGWEANVQKR